MSGLEYSGPPRILIVDDNTSIHRDFEIVLLDDLHNSDLEEEERRLYANKAAPVASKPIYIVEHAFSGTEGVEKVRQALVRGCPYQLAFVDIRMPGIDGVETIERIWKVDPCIQIVICTAYADYSWDDLARRLGPTDKLLVLKKPFDNIEVRQFASTLTEKWFLAKQAALKLEQMEWLVAQRTQKLLDLVRHQELSAGGGKGITAPGRMAPDLPCSSGAPEGAAGSDGGAAGKELPVLLLVTEDEAKLGVNLSQGLAQEYRVVKAADTEQGILKAQEIVPDLVMTELSGPRVDGIQLCRQLKRDELASHIPVVMLTTAGMEALQIKALEAGADEHITKPLSLPLFKARVDHLLAARRGLHESLAKALPLFPREMAANQSDAHFLRRSIAIVDRHLADFEFDVDVFAQKMAMSRRQLFRKLKAVTDFTPNGFIRTLRLNRAAQLLKESQLTVTEITYAVGFSDLKHFRTVFREHFGVLPGDYAPRPGREGEARESAVADAQNATKQVSGVPQ